MKRLIKESKFYNAFKDDNNTIEIFINPTTKEINDAKKQGYKGNIRGVIYDDGTTIIWPGNILHDYIVNKNMNIDVNQFRFAWENTSWLIDCHEKYTIQEAVDLVNKYENKLNQIGDISARFDIVYTKDINPEDNTDSLVYYISNKVASKTKRLIKKSLMSIETFTSTLEGLGDSGRKILKDIEDYKFKLEQAARIVQNDPDLTQKIIQKKKVLDQTAGQVYSIVFDIENIDITQAYEMQQMPPEMGFGAPDGEMQPEIMQQPGQPGQPGQPPIQPAQPIPTDMEPGGLGGGDDSGGSTDETSDESETDTENTDTDANEEESTDNEESTEK